jgi:hypothetical protein
MSRLFVGNLSFQTTAFELGKLFETVGEVVIPTIARSKGFGFVELMSADVAKEAVEKLNDSELNGRFVLEWSNFHLLYRKIHIEISKSQGPRPQQSEGGRRFDRGDNQRGGFFFVLIIFSFLYLLGGGYRRFGGNRGGRGGRFRGGGRGGIVFLWFILFIILKEEGIVKEVLEDLQEMKMHHDLQLEFIYPTWPLQQLKQILQKNLVNMVSRRLL